MPRRRNPWKTKTKNKIWRIKEKKPNWVDLPPELTANILHRLGAIEILENAQKVCTAWRNICKDPAMWRVIDMLNTAADFFAVPYDLEKTCMHAIDRSQGQLVDIKIEYFGTDGLIDYMVDRSSQLRRLQVVRCYGSMYESWSEIFKKLPLLEELSLVLTDISKEAIADAGQYCPMMRSFKFTKRWLRPGSYAPQFMCSPDEEAIAIAKNMTQLRHLELVGNSMTNKGLQAILDGCPHLISLDLRRCFNIILDRSLGERCSEQIKDLHIDSPEDYEFHVDDEDDYPLMSHDFDNSDYEEELSDYDIYCGPCYNPYEDISDVDDHNLGHLSDFEDFLAEVEGIRF